MILRRTLALASRGRLSILIFHRVLRERDPLLPTEPTGAEFDSLLAHLANRFSILPLAEAVERLYGGTLPRSAMAITFDDGYADNLSVAAPILAIVLKSKIAGDIRVQAKEKVPAAVLKAEGARIPTPVNVVISLSTTLKNAPAIG